MSSPSSLLPIVRVLDRPISSTCLPKGVAHVLHRQQSGDGELVHHDDTGTATRSSPLN